MCQYGVSRDPTYGQSRSGDDPTWPKWPILLRNRSYSWPRPSGRVSNGVKRGLKWVILGVYLGSPLRTSLDPIRPDHYTCGATWCPEWVQNGVQMGSRLWG